MEDDYSFLTPRHAHRLLRQYGLRARLILGDATAYADLGQCFGSDLYEAEVRYQVEREWVMQADDAIWRRTKEGLNLLPAEKERLEEFLVNHRMPRESEIYAAGLASVSKTTLERWGWLEPQARLTISSFHFEQLERSLKVMPQVAHGWLLPEVTADAIEAAAGLGLSGIYPNVNEVTADDMKLTKDAGLSVRTWGIGNSRQALERAYRSGAMGTTIDWPTQARDFLKGL